MDTKIHEIISILPVDLQQLALQHKEFVASFKQILPSKDNAIASLQKETIYLREQIVDLQELNAFLESEIKRLKNLLLLDSHNSNKPLSTDISRKQKMSPFRKSSGLHPKEQKGHSGTALKQVPNPDHKNDIKIAISERCGNKGKFPEDVNIKRLVLYLNQRQFIPYNRTKEIIEDLCGHSVSERTLWNINNKAYRNLEVTSKEIQQAIINSEVVCADETGEYVNGNKHWLHTASTEDYTYYYSHENRGNRGMDVPDILPNFHGICVWTKDLQNLIIIKFK